MNIEKINVNNINNIYNKNNNFKEGDIVNGYIKSSKDNTYTIDLENKLSINIDKDKIVGEVGDTVYFKVIDNKNTLNQILQQNVQENVQTYDLDENIKNEPNNFQGIVKSRGKRSLAENITQDINKPQQQYKIFLDKNTQPSAKENLLYTSNVKNKTSHLSNTLTKSDLQKFINEGINPKNLDVLTFSDFLSISTGVDVEKKEKAEEKTLQELKEDKKKAMKMDLNMNGVDEEALFSFESILSSVGLPATPKNLSTLQNVKEKIENIENLDKDTSLNLVKKGSNITIDDLYTSKYSRFSNKENIEIDKIKNIDTQIESILKENNLDVTEENINIAKDFIKNEVDISYENIEKYKKLLNIKEEINIEDILEKTAKNILKNENTLNVDIFNNQNIEEDYKKYKNILPKVSPEHIQSLINSNIKINLKNIVTNYENIKTENVNITEDALSEKLKLSKIQLKLTSDAMYSLYNKGINIDTKPLRDVINHLENLEQENYKKYLAIAKSPTTPENVNTMTKVFSTIQNIYPSVMYNTFKDIVQEKVDFSLDGINKSLKMQNIIDDFETFKTMPNRSFGDSINKLTDDFKDLLVQNGFDPTENNIRALKILSLNGIDFTEENLLNVKILDNKLDYVANNLHPLTVAQMLKDNFNPMEKNINDVIDYIDNNSFAQTSREKISEQILDIDRENKLSKEERDAVVAVYRMLNAVQKNDNVAIGNLLKTEKNITLLNLLDASKTYDKNRRNINFDRKIDKTTGKIEKIVPEANISNSIKKGIEKANENYNKFILGQILNYADSDKISQINDTNINIEDVLDMLKTNDKKTLSIDAKEDFIKSIQNLDNNIIDYLIKNNIPITFNNIEVMENIIKQKITPGKNIDDFKEELEKRDISFGESIFNINDSKNTTKEELIDTVKFLEEENNEVFDDIINLDDLDDIKYMILKNKNVASNINFIQDNNNIKNGIYTLPVKLSNGKIKDLNMYILNDNALNDKNLNLYLNFENADNKYIEAYIKLSEKGNLAEIVSSSNDNIQKYQKDILNILDKFKIYPEKITYSTNNEKNLYKEDDIFAIQEKFKEIDNNFNKTI